jgi:2,3-dihydroxyphenylpropionate 1,2-dioxygenase
LPNAACEPEIAVACLSHSPQMAEDRDQRQGATFRRGLADLTGAVRRFSPTLVIFFGPDHMRALSTIAPCFTVVRRATGYGDWGTARATYDIPAALTGALADHLVAEGLDIAIATQLALDHGFGQSMGDIFGGLDAIPTIPLIINCVDAPLATVRRTAALGEAVGSFIRGKVPGRDRVLILASGGISHAPPSLAPGVRDLSEESRYRLIQNSLAAAADAINPEWDREFLALLAGENWRSAGELTHSDLEPAGSGGAEVRTWIAALFAGGTSLATVAYEPVPEWITGMGIAVAGLTL